MGQRIDQSRAPRFGSYRLLCLAVSTPGSPAGCDFVEGIDGRQRAAVAKTLWRRTDGGSVDRTNAVLAQQSRIEFWLDPTKNSARGHYNGDSAAARDDEVASFRKFCVGVRVNQQQGVSVQAACG